MSNSIPSQRGLYRDFLQRQPSKYELLEAGIQMIVNQLRDVDRRLAALENPLPIKKPKIKTVKEKAGKGKK